MNILKNLAITLLFFSFISVSAFAQEDDAFTKDIKKFFEVSGGKKLYEAIIPQLLAQFKTMFPNAPADQWNELEQEMKGSATDEIFALLVPIYKKHFTHKTSNNLLSFIKLLLAKRWQLKLLQYPRKLCK